MTQLHIQPRGRTVWPWIAGLAILALVAGLIWRSGHTEGADARMVSSGDVETPTANQGVPAILLVQTTRLADFVNRPPDFGDLNRAHEYTRTGLRYLADALDEVATRSAAPRAKIAALRQSAEELGETGTVTHAKIASVTFGQAADAIAEVQQARYPSLGDDVTRVRRAAAAISPDRELLSQKDEIKAFFAAATNALQHMGAAAPTTSPSTTDSDTSTGGVR